MSVFQTIWSRITQSKIASSAPLVLGETLHDEKTSFYNNKSEQSLYVSSKDVTF